MWLGIWQVRNHETAVCAGLSLPRRSETVRVGQDVEFEDPVLLSDFATKLGKRTEGHIGVITGE